MSDFLDDLIQRNQGSTSVLRPRLASRFESLGNPFLSTKALRSFAVDELGLDIEENTPRPSSILGKEEPLPVNKLYRTPGEILTDLEESPEVSESPMGLSLKLQPNLSASDTGHEKEGNTVRLDSISTNSPSLQPAREIFHHDTTLKVVQPTVTPLHPPTQMSMDTLHSSTQHQATITKVTIGRIEVRLNKSAPSSSRRIGPTPHRPIVSLESYLKKHRGEKE